MKLDNYPSIKRITEATDTQLMSYPASDPEQGGGAIYAVGSPGESASGQLPWTLTMTFGTLDELDAFCAKHVDSLENWPDDKPWPYLETDLAC